MSCAPFIQWKEEPLSPLSTDEVAWFSDDAFYQTSPEHEDLKFEDDLVPCENKAEVASLMLENLENLINLDELIKEEPFLLDEKILPILEDVPSKMEYTPIRAPDTQFLLKEFETVYDVVEFSHETLTPPQSPPSSQKILTTLEPLLHVYTPVPEKPLLPLLHVYAPVPEKPLLPQTLDAISGEEPDYAQALAVVDELVRTRVEDMQWSPSSPTSTSSSSNFGDCSSDDPEWQPEPAEEGFVEEKPTRKRAKPYSRAANGDRKSRKKEQNKNAATRYRMKKKAEVEVILGEEKVLANKNDDLEDKIKDMQREIKYLKGLMRDLFKAKGLIN